MLNKKDYQSIQSSTSFATSCKHSQFSVSLDDDGDSSVVRAPDSCLKGHRFESLQVRRENFLLQG